MGCYYRDSVRRRQDHGLLKKKIIRNNINWTGWSAVSYGPSFFPLDSRAGHKSKGKIKLGSVNYSTNRENEVSRLFIYLGGVSDDSSNDL